MGGDSRRAWRRRPAHRRAGDTRGGRSVGLGQQFSLQLRSFSSNPWTWEKSHEWVPLPILLLVAAGRVWGLHQRFVDRQDRRPHGFPF